MQIYQFSFLNIEFEFTQDDINKRSSQFNSTKTESEFMSDDFRESLEDIAMTKFPELNSIDAWTDGTTRYNVIAYH